MLSHCASAWIKINNTDNDKTFAATDNFPVRHTETHTVLALYNTTNNRHSGNLNELNVSVGARDHDKNYDYVQIEAFNYFGCFFSLSVVKFCFNYSQPSGNKIYDEVNEMNLVKKSKEVISIGENELSGMFSFENAGEENKRSTNGRQK